MMVHSYVGEEVEQDCRVALVGRVFPEAPAQGCECYLFHKTKVSVDMWDVENPMLLPCGQGWWREPGNQPALQIGFCTSMQSHTSLCAGTLVWLNPREI